MVCGENVIEIDLESQFIVRKLIEWVKGTE
jgi:hypothetical protein